MIVQVTKLVSYRKYINPVINLNCLGKIFLMAKDTESKLKDWIDWNGLKSFKITDKSSKWTFRILNP